MALLFVYYNNHIAVINNSISCHTQRHIVIVNLTIDKKPTAASRNTCAMWYNVKFWGCLHLPEISPGDKNFSAFIQLFSLTLMNLSFTSPQIEKKSEYYAASFDWVFVEEKGKNFPSFKTWSLGEDPYILANTWMLTASGQWPWLIPAPHVFRVQIIKLPDCQAIQKTFKYLKLKWSKKKTKLCGTTFFYPMWEFLFLESFPEDSLHTVSSSFSFADSTVMFPCSLACGSSEALHWAFLFINFL